VTPEVVIGLLADPRRRKVFAALVLGARNAEEIADASGLEPKDVDAAVRKLAAAGLAELDGATIEPRENVFAELAMAASVPAPADDHGYADARVEQVISTFVRAGRLTGLPAQHGKRQLVLEHVAQTFEPGVRYPEAEVNVILRAWCADGPVDYVTLRRYLVDYGLLSRADGEYWRSGGWVDVLDAIRTDPNPGPPPATG
jgi:hypothetical protein